MTGLICLTGDSIIGLLFFLTELQAFKLNSVCRYLRKKCVQFESFSMCLGFHLITFGGPWFLFFQVFSKKKIWW